MRRVPSATAAFTARIADSAAALRLLDQLDRRRRTPGLAVLMYHRIADPPTLAAMAPELASATPAGFADQVAYLAARRPLISLDDLLAARRGERALPPRAVMLTFDDAYRDFAEHAWPVLRRHGAPVTLFVATAYPDRPDRAYWWDRLDAALAAVKERAQIVCAAGALPLATAEDRRRARRAITEWVWRTPHDEAMAELERIFAAIGGPPIDSGVLGWEDLRRLRAEGVGIGAHSQTHPILHRVRLERALTEVFGSIADLERELGPVPSVLAYPGGGLSPELVDALSAAGLEAAFTTQHRINELPVPDWLRIARLNVGPRTHRGVLGVQLLPGLAQSHALRSLRHPA
jgi:peptidoglycan/xylan/chitin deacetylase (PgdA/CDA1 family)